MTAHDTIAAALSAFQAEMPTVAKTKQANAGSYRYTYADLADVQAAAMPLLTKHGLAFTCLPGFSDGALILTGRLMHASGFLEGSLPLFGRQAQELGSSITYARRYLFGALTGVVTDDDDDGHSATQGRTATQPKPSTGEQGHTKAQRKPTPTPTPTPAPPVDDPPPADPNGATDAQLRKMGVGFRAAGITDRDDRLMYVKQIIGREVQSSKELSKREASLVIDALSTPAELDPQDEPDPWAGAS